jgi:hypothetical protein
MSSYFLFSLRVAHYSRREKWATREIPEPVLETGATRPLDSICDVHQIAL